jgi:hypothetical protein
MGIVPDNDVLEAAVARNILCVKFIENPSREVVRLVVKSPDFEHCMYEDLFDTDNLQLIETMKNIMLENGWYIHRNGCLIKSR